MYNYGKYDDIINLPHYEPKKHPRMSKEARAAQFAPFAALTGYDDVIKETARLTSKRIEINEELKAILDAKLQIIHDKISSKPEISFTYFVPDTKKDGGSYVTVKGNVIKIDEFSQNVILENRTEIPIAEIVEITGEILKENEIR